jgi:outer membrane murein-binding lipoprotein Lpp
MQESPPAAVEPNDDLDGSGEVSGTIEDQMKAWRVRVQSKDRRLTEEIKSKAQLQIAHDQLAEELAAARFEIQAAKLEAVKAKYPTAYGILEGGDVPEEAYQRLEARLSQYSEEFEPNLPEPRVDANNPRSVFAPVKSLSDRSEEELIADLQRMSPGWSTNR